MQKDFESEEEDIAGDLIVLGRSAAIEDAANKAAQRVQVPFTPGRTEILAGQSHSPCSNRPLTVFATILVKVTTGRRQKCWLIRRVCST